MAAPRVIHGSVVDREQRPLAGARVVIAHELEGTIIYCGGTMLNVTERQPDQLPGVGKLAGKTTGTVTTSDDGRFVFEDVAEGRFTLVAVHPAHGVAIVPEVSSSSAGAIGVALRDPTVLTARLEHLNFDPQWDVVNLEGESPLPNLQLLLRMEQSAKGVTGDGGGLEFNVGPIPEGYSWSLVVLGRNSALGFTVPRVSTPVAIESGKHNQFELDASAGEQLSGRVVGPDSKPLSDVAVMARAADASLGMRGTFTDAEGAYSLQGLSPGAYNLELVRHRLRSEIGCGFGPIDVQMSRRIMMPLDAVSEGDLKIDSLASMPEVGDKAPAFSAPTIDGKTLNLADYQGRVVLLDFWATWCSLCLADMKHIAKLHDELRERGDFAVISISLDTDPRAVERFLRRQQLPWPQLVLGPADSNPIAKTYNAMSTPTTVLIDREGRIAARHVPGEQLRDEVLKLLDAAP